MERRRPRLTRCSIVAARSREVADLLIQGNRTSGSPGSSASRADTVKYHVRRVYSLLGVSSRVELMRLANRNQVK